MEEVAKNINTPPEFEFKPSAANKMKIGVWSKCVIKKDELFGPFKGVKKRLAEVLDGTYSWEIRGPKGRRIFTIDASDPSKGNWMRYVKTARYYDQQNMTAIQKGKQIFYKSLKKISKGEELLCWYKEERTATDGKDVKAKSAVVPDTTSKNEVFDRKGSGSNDESTNAEDRQRDSEPSNGKDEISITTQSNTSKDSTVVDVVQGACIKLSGLTDSIQKVIATSQCSGSDKRSREPVVRLVPLSAEIKLKVHLDLDIRLDADLKMRSYQTDSDKSEYPVSQKLEFHSDDFCSQLTICDQAVKSMSESPITILPKEDQFSAPVTSYTVSKTEVKGISIKEEKKYLIKEENKSIAVKDEKSSIAVNEEKSGIAKSETKTSNVLRYSDKQIPSHNVNDACIKSEGSSDIKSKELKGFQASVVPALLVTDEHSHAHEESNARSDQSLKDNLQSHDATVCKNVPRQKEHEIMPEHSVKQETTPSALESSIANPEIIKSIKENDLPCHVLGHDVEPKTDDTLKTDNTISEKVSDVQLGNTINKNDKIVDYTVRKVDNDQNYALHKNESAPGSNKESKLKRVKKKRKKFGCKICSREFRKPFQLKMHIIRTHEKRERKFRQYIISKREIIRTRSKSYEEEAKTKSPQQTGSELVGSQPNQITGASYNAISGDSSINQPYSVVENKLLSENKVQHQPSVRNVQDQSIVSNEIQECQRCKRTFQYKSWLDRHLFYHQKQDLIDQQKLTIPIPRDDRNEMSVLKKEAIGTTTPSKFPGLLGNKHAASMFPKDRPFSCSECGKQFTTKKNCRRHKRLIHNILVRPERTKLHYTNYTVEKPFDAIANKSPRMSETAVCRDKTSKSETKLLNRWRNEAKARKTTTDGRSSSSGIAVRLFDPSRLNLPEMSTNSTKIQWGVSSNRTGPPPAARNDETHDETYRRRLDQEVPALNDVSGMTNPWRTTQKPNPFIPRKKKVERERKKISHTVQEPTNLIVPKVPKKHGLDHKSSRSANPLQTKRPIDMSSMSIKEVRRASFSTHDVTKRASKMVHCKETASTNPSANQTFGNKTEKMIIKKEPSDVISNLKRKLDLHQDYNKVQRQREVLPPQLVPVSAHNQKVHSHPALLNIPTMVQNTGSTGGPVLNQKHPVHSHAEKKKKEESSELMDFQKTFTCNVCNVVFATYQQMNQHVSFHADRWPFKCEICAKLFQAPQELVYHRNTHASVSQTFSCKVCNDEFASMKLLKEHQIYIHGRELPQQPMELPKSKPVEAMQTPKTTAMFKCTKCSEEFMETAPFHSHIIDCALSSS